MALPSYVADASTTEMAANGSSYAVTLPTYQADDLVVIQLYNVNSGGATNTTASATGWTQLDNRGNNIISSQRQIIMYRPMTSDDVSGGVTSVTLTFGGSSATSNKAKARAITIRGVDTVSPFDGAIAAGTFSGGSTSVTTASKATSLTDTLILCFMNVGWSAGSSSGFTPSTVGATERWDELAGGNRAQVCVEFPAQAVGTYTISGTESVASAGVGVLAAVAASTSTNPTLPPHDGNLAALLRR